MNTAIRVLDQVSLLDEYIRIMNGHRKGFCIDDDERI